jgi:hypothetical protein
VNVPLELKETQSQLGLGQLMQRKREKRRKGVYYIHRSLPQLLQSSNSLKSHLSSVLDMYWYYLN